jgi:hypothetical protein
MTRFPGAHRERPSDAQQNAATCLAMFGLLAMGLALIGFTALVLPQIRGLLLVVGGIAAFILLHYVTWGHWLSNQPPPDDGEPEL